MKKKTIKSKASEFGVESGRQQLILKRNPNGTFNELTDRRLPLYFVGAEWTAIFRRLSTSPRQPLKDGENIVEWEERQKTLFAKSIPSFPMLGRIWDTYVDVTYEPREIAELREECVRVQKISTDQVALRGLKS